MQIKIERIKPTRYEKVMLFVSGLVFLLIGVVSFIQNFPQLFSSTPVSYTFSSYSGQSHLNNTWQQSFPAYSKLIYPPVFVIGGLLCFVFGFSRNRKLKDFMAGLFTLSLGLMLAYFFQPNFPLVLIPLVFVVIGIFIVWFGVIKKS